MAGLKDVEIEAVLNASDSSDEETVSSDESVFLCEEDELENSSSSEENENISVIGPGGDASTSVLNFTAPNNFVGDVGAIHSLEAGASELSYFEYMLGGDCVFRNIAQYTNSYAAFRQEQCNKADKNWEDTSAEEIQAYIGVLIFMGLFPLPETRDYWHSQDIQCPLIRNCMTYQRYKMLTKYLHVVDVTSLKDKNDPSYDMLQKVQPLLDILNNFQNKYNPGRELAVDEAMIPFKGRNIMKQYIKEKPVKWGFKVWVLAAPNGYVLRGNLYRGKKEPRNKDMLLGNQIVFNLLEDRQGLNHHVYFDSFFSSVGLLQNLKDKGIYACSTARFNRKDWPREIKNPKALKLKRGDSRIVQVGDVTAYVWHDNRNICALSTNCDPKRTITVQRKTGKGNERVPVSCPLAIAQYTKFMGGVDRADQKRSYYSLGRKTVKWWKYIFGFVLNTAIVNSFILYNETNQPSLSRHGFTQRNFRLCLYRQIIGNFSSRKQSGRKRSLPLSISSPKGCHKIQKINGRKKVCVNCSASGKKAASGRGVQTSWECMKCNLPLCRVGCFLHYHEEKGVEVQN